MIDLTRRSFLGGLAAAIAAPYVVRSGILMPVKKILQPAVVSRLQGSYDGQNWFDIMRMAGRPISSNPLWLYKGQPGMVPFDPINHAIANSYLSTTPLIHTRVIVEQEWKPVTLESVDRVAAVRRYG